MGLWHGRLNWGRVCDGVDGGGHCRRRGPFMIIEDRRECDSTSEELMRDRRCG